MDAVPPINSCLGAAAQTTFEAASRQGLRSPPLSSCADPSSYPAPHRLARDREQSAAETLPRGRRADAGLVRPVPSPRHSLRATKRPSISHSRRWPQPSLRSVSSNDGFLVCSQEGRPPAWSRVSDTSARTPSTAQRVKRL